MALAASRHPSRSRTTVPSSWWRTAPAKSSLVVHLTDELRSGDCPKLLSNHANHSDQGPPLRVMRSHPGKAHKLLFDPVHFGRDLISLGQGLIRTLRNLVVEVVHTLFDRIQVVRYRIYSPGQIGFIAPQVHADDFRPTVYALAWVNRERKQFAHGESGKRGSVVGF